VILLLLGAPGSGKGTQGRRLAENFGIPYMASGDLLKRAIEQHSSLGEQVRQFVERGLYVPDHVMVPAAMEELARLRSEHATVGVVLDGFPRTREQAETLDEALAARDESLERVLFLHVPKEVLLSRLAGRWTCGTCLRSYNVLTHPPKQDMSCDVDGSPLFQRVDDRAETVERRLTVYLESTVPLVAYYKKTNRLTEVDGNRPETEVTAALIAAAERDGVPRASDTQEVRVS